MENTPSEALHNQQEPTTPDQEAQDTAQEMHPETEASSDKEHNMRVLRERAESVERDKNRLQQERDAYYTRLQELQNASAKTQESEDPSLAPDDLVEWKYVQKELKKVKDEFNSYKQQSQASSAETRLKIQYPDFEHVVTSYNIDRLRNEYPELAATINTNNDVYTKAVAAYTMIKKLNLSPSDDQLKTHARIQENNQKPRPTSTLSPQQGESPLQRANAFAGGLTPELKAALLKEMNEARKKI